MPEQDFCDSCGLRVPAEFIETCGACGATLCPLCSEDGCRADQHQDEQLPLAA